MPIKNKHFQNDYYSSSEWSAACICLFKCSAISTCGKASASPTPSHCARYTPHKLCKSSMVNVQFLFLCWSCGLGCALRPAPLQCMVLACSLLQEHLRAGRGFSAGRKVYPPVMGNRVTWTWGCFSSLCAVLHSLHWHLVLWWKSDSYTAI